MNIWTMAGLLLVGVAIYHRQRLKEYLEEKLGLVRVWRCPNCSMKASIKKTDC